MLVQVLHVLEHAILERAADGDVVEDRDVLHVLAKADAARVRADGDAELGREQQHRENFVQASQPAGVELAESDRLSL